MKKNSIFILVAAIVGLLAGYLFFGNSSQEKSEMEMHDHSAHSDNEVWTCSMHPQIRQSEPGSCPICSMDLIPAETSADGLSEDQFKMTENAMALANVQTTVVGNAMGSTENKVSLSGKIAVNEEANAIQASYFDGRIERLNVNYEGQEVRKGQLLATIYSPELVAAQQELLTAASLKETQSELYNAVRNKLKLWKLSEKQINTIETSGKVTENFPVYATVSGTVMEVMRAEGDYIKKGQPIAKVSNLNTVWAAFDAYESQLSQFKKGQQITITTNAYPNKTFEGTISFIDPILNNATRTVMVRATLNNRENLFKPGMFVTAQLENGANTTTDEHLYVPSSAVLWTGERSVIYVKAKADEPVFEMREVMVGAKNGEEVEVTFGLDAGEEIVTNGAFTVDAAAQLQGKKSMMNKSGGRTTTGHEGHTGMQEGHQMETMEHSMKMELPAAFQSSFKQALPAYLKMKDAFVASDAASIAQEAKTTLEGFKKLDQSAIGKMEKGHLSISIEMLEAISKNEDLENQRAHFVILNENLVALASNLESLEGTVYVQQCPMADNNQGAVWLSTEQEIRNPYFGDAMLTCGSVIETLD